MIKLARWNCTLETLMEEWIEWRATNGVGRNREDLRFGQYIVNHYLGDGQTAPVIFNKENADEAYKLILEEVWS